MTATGDEWMFRLTLATGAATLVSIAAAQILLTLTLTAWLILRPRAPRWPAYFVPLAAFAAATLVSLAMSADPSVGLGPVRKFVLFSMGVLAATFVTSERRLRQTVMVTIAVASAAAVAGLVQFGLQYSVYRSTGSLADDPTVLARATGFMGHWMTFSGEQMLVWSFVLPLLAVLSLNLFRIGAVLIGASLLFSFTRSAWLGALAATGVSAVSVSFRRMARVLIPIGAIAVLGAGLVWNRVAMSFTDGVFAPDSGRIEMAAVAARMVGDDPLFGVGPERVAFEFADYYRGNDIEDLYTGHLHNNFLQIAAERGLLGLAAFLWLLVRIGMDMVRFARSADGIARWTGVAGLSVLVAFTTAGLFEYNFGDSEVLMLFLFLVSIPYGVRARQSLW